MAEEKRDENRVPSAMGVNINDDDETLPIKISPTTDGVIVDVVTS